MLEPQRARVETGALDLPLFDDESDTLTDEPKPRAPWWRSRQAIIVASAVVIVALLGGTLAVAAHGRGNQVTYTTQQVGTGNLTVSVSATGPVQGPLYNVSVSGSSKIAEIDVKVGQQVKAGDTLAKLDVTSLQDALNQAQAQVNSAQVSLNNAYTSRDKTTTSAQASENSAYQTEQVTLAGCSNPKNGETTSQCQSQAEAQYNAAVAQAEAQISSARGQVSSAQASLASAQAGVQTAEHNLSNATITAPHAGTVAAINGEVGGTPGGSSSSSGSGSASSGGSGGTFIEIADLSSLQVAANVNEADIGSVATGEQVQFTVTAYSSRQFRGTVSAISPVGQTSSNVVTYPVTIDVDMTRVQGVNLFPGMTASATIVTAQRVGVTLVPARAVTFARTAANPANGIISTTDLRSAALQAAQKLRGLRTSNPDIAKENPTAAVVLERSNGKWVIKPVILGLTDGTNYVVLDGLSSGETVVTGQQGGTLSTSTSGTTPFGGNGNGRGGGGFGGGFGGGLGGGGNGGAGRGNGG